MFIFTIIYQPKQPYKSNVMLALKLFVEPEQKYVGYLIICIFLGPIIKSVATLTYFVRPSVKKTVKNNCRFETAHEAAFTFLE